MSGGSSLQAITLLSLVAISLVEVNIQQSSFVAWTHVTAWSKECLALWLDMWLLIISHRSIKFDSDRSRESEFKAFSICHVTLCDHVINRLCDLMDNKPVLKFGSHRSRGSWDITFLICYVIIWSRDQSVKRLNRWLPFTINLHLVKFDSHGSRGNIVFY